ncbi:MAG: radical SAM protein [Candidatus Thorarchaeota archaeon]
MRTNESLIEHYFELSETELTSLFDRAYSISREEFSNKIAFYAPGMVHYETDYHEATDPYRFPSISITGEGCSLNCKHCSGKLLETMVPAITPESLWQTCQEIHEKGGTGCLISGGATPRGNTPLQPYIPTLKRVKEELGLDIVVHTGIVYPEIAEALGEAGIDGAMMDIIGSEETLREVYHLDLPLSVFDESMTLLEEYNIPHMPHIIAGLHYGKLHGEAKAIEMIANHDPSSIVVVAFMPLDCTPMENVAPASPMDIARVILATRLTIPDKPLILGCARPLGMHRRKTDILAIDAGVNGIAYPSDEGYEYAQEKGLTIAFADECCSLISKVL